MVRKIEFSEIRKEELTKAAIRSVALKGFDLVTLDDVAKEAGFSKGIVTYYFKSRDELLISVVRMMWANLLDMTRDAWELPDQIDDPEEVYSRVREYYANPKVDLIAVIKNGVNILVSMFDENRHILRVTGELWCQVPRNKMVAELSTHMQEVIIGTTAVFIQAGAKRGVFKKRNPQLAAYILVSTITGAAFSHVVSKGSLDSKKLKKELTDHILLYLCN